VQVIEVRIQTEGPFDEQRHRRCKRFVPVGSVGRQRPQREPVLPRQVERCAAGDEAHRGGAGLQQCLDLTGGSEHVFEVVEDDQRRCSTQRVGHQRRRVDQRARRCGHCARDAPGDVGRGSRSAQVDEDHGQIELPSRSCGDLHGQTGLADSWRAGDRHQSGGSASDLEAVEDGHHVRVAPDEASRRCREDAWSLAHTVGSVSETRRTALGASGGHEGSEVVLVELERLGQALGHHLGGAALVGLDLADRDGGAGHPVGQLGLGEVEDPAPTAHPFTEARCLHQLLPSHRLHHRDLRNRSGCIAIGIAR
jgi:hypothetical protein